MINIIKNKMKKMYSTGAFHVVLGTFATKFVVFFGSIVVVRIMTKEDYGLLSYVDNIYSYAFVFAGLGLVHAVVRFLIISEEIEVKKSIFTYIMKNSFFRDILIAVILFIISNYGTFPNKYSSVRYLLPIVALLLPLQDMVNINLYTIRAFFENKLYVWLAFGTSFILIMGRILGAYYEGVKGVLWSRVSLNGLFVLLLLVIIKQKFFKDIRPKSVSKETKFEINAFSLQMMVTDGLWVMFMLNDTFLLGQLLNNPAGLADYKVASVLPGNISIFANAIGMFVAPYFTKNEKNRKWIKTNYYKVFVVNALVVGIICMAIGLTAKPLILIIYGKDYLNIIDLMRMLLIVAFINSGLRYTSANILSALGKAKCNLIISCMGIVMQVVLDILFIPIWGEMAVAYINCLIYVFMAIALYFFVYRYFDIKDNC